MTWQKLTKSGKFGRGGGRGTAFGFFPSEITDTKCLIEADLVGGGGRIDPQFVILFSELGGRSNCFLSKTDICL